MSESEDWYVNWFDTPFYHILYKNRDLSEASAFIHNLVDRLAPKRGDKVLDLACGKGRHSISLSQKGLDVTGVDLSRNSIERAKYFEHDFLHFEVHDMRKVFRAKHFDYVFNLFTSFGYFDEVRDNEKAIYAAAENLKPKGIFVLDFLNATKTINELVSEEKRVVDGIEFNIKRSVENRVIRKQISLQSGSKEYLFEERVQAFKLQDFEKFFQSATLKIEHLWGDYNLHPFDENESERLILVAEKK